MLKYTVSLVLVSLLIFGVSIYYAILNSEYEVSILNQSGSHVETVHISGAVTDVIYNFDRKEEKLLRYRLKPSGKRFIKFLVTLSTGQSHEVKDVLISNHRVVEIVINSDEALIKTKVAGYL